MCCEDVFYRFDPRKICVVSGDIPTGCWELRGCLMLKCHRFFGECGTGESDKLNLDEAIARLDTKDCKDAYTCADLLGVGIGVLAGLRYFGLPGAIGGALIAHSLRGKHQRVTVDVHLTDSRHFEANMDKNVYERLQAIFNRNDSEPGD